MVLHELIHLNITIIVKSFIKCFIL
ncbi:hypothetical protein PO124_14060 [Bacillus licheniformis]|nr:hypothetical protein [Bacillus licheniformis]